jgi:adenylate cyclase
MVPYIGDDELLGDLTGQARRERAELIQRLRAHDFDVEQIRGALIPMLLPAHRVVGDDGTYVSAQQLRPSTSPNEPRGVSRVRVR